MYSQASKRRIVVGNQVGYFLTEKEVVELSNIVLNEQSLFKENSANRDTARFYKDVSNAKESKINEQKNTIGYYSALADSLNEEISVLIQNCNGCEKELRSVKRWGIFAKRKR